MRHAQVVFRCAIVALGCVSLLACDPRRGRLAGRAADQWARTYPLNADGELQIVAGHGSIDVTGASQTTVDLRADRVVRAFTDASARGLLPNVRIREEATADHLLLQDQGLGDAMVGVDVEVHFHVVVPRTTRLRLRVLNGDIRVSDVDGAVVASTTDGRIDATGLVGSLDARTTNGAVRLQIARLSGPISVESADGSIDLILPANSAASLRAQTSRGTVGTGGLPLTLDEPLTDRRVRGRLNGGGLPIALMTSDGNIELRAAP